MYKKYVKHIVSMLLALCMVVTAALGNVSGWGSLQADAAETTELTPITFSNFNLDGPQSGSIWAACGSSLIDKVFHGYFTLSNATSTPYIVFGSDNRWNGVQLVILNGNELHLAAGSIGTVSGGGKVTATQAKMATGSFIGEEFLVSISFRTTEKDSNGTTTALELQVTINDSAVISANVTNVNTSLLNGLMATHNASVSVRSYTPSTEPDEPEEPVVPDEPEVTTEPLKLTFADFKMADGSYSGDTTGTLNTKADSSLIDTVFEGYFTMSSGKQYLIFGYTGDSWYGLQFVFFNDQLHVATSNVGVSNPCTYVFKKADAKVSTFFDTPFKLSVSFESTDLDNNSETTDVIMQIKINDELCVASQVTPGSGVDASLCGANGSYQLRGVNEERLKGYVRLAQGGTVKSIEPGDEFESLTFADFGVGDQSFSGGSTGGVYPGSLKYTELKGHVTFAGGAAALNYGATTSNNTNFGGMTLNYYTTYGNFNKLHVSTGTRLGGAWKNDYDGGSDNAAFYGFVGASYDISSADGFELSIATQPWDYDGDGMDDGKIAIRINGELLGASFIVIENMFAEETSLVSRLGLVGGQNWGLEGTVTVLSDRSVLQKLRKVTLADFGRESGTYTSMGYTKTGPQSLLNTMMEMDLTVNGTLENGTWIQYAVPSSLGEWHGIRFQVQASKINVSSTQGMFTAFEIPISTIKDATSFLNTPFKMGISIEKVDLARDGANNDVRFGFWINGSIYKYIYGTDVADNVGTGLSIMPAAGGAGNTVTVSNPTETSTDFETMGLADMTTAPVESGVYQSASAGGLKGINGTKDGDLNGKIFTTNIRFTDEFSQLFYGCDTSNKWYAIKIGSNGGNSAKFILQSSFSDSLVGTNETGAACDTGVKEIAMNAIGFDLFDNTFELGISTRNVDCDGDDVFDDVELGLWFEGRLYNNAYFYLPNIAGYMNPNLAVYTWQGGKAANEGQVILGDYTQETPTEVEYCADDYIYAVAGKNAVTVNSESKGTSWSTGIPDEYQIEYTEKNSTFKENVLVYKTNDVTADGTVGVADLVALLKLAAEQRPNTTVAGKKAVNYVDSASFNSESALANMQAQLLKSDNVIGAKEMSEDIIGVTGSKGATGEATYITDLGTTKEGTSVISISDTANAEDRTYATDVEALDGTGLDFILDFDRSQDKEIKVLQITDTQIIDSAQCRTADRLTQASKDLWASDQMDARLFDELDQLITAQQPDLILLTGDIIYGEFDDKGTSFNKIIEVMDSYKIPWAPIFGNHDNESEIGVAEQCRRFVEESDYCLFNRRNEIGGNGNYSIGIATQGELQRTIFMMDSNGCSNVEKLSDEDKAAITTTFKFHDTQIAWYQTVAERVNAYAKTEIPSLMCFHVPAMEMTSALIDKGHQAAADIKGQVTAKYDLGMDATQEDFGFKQDRIVADSGLQHYILPYLQMSGTDGVFFGHQHCTSLSVQWEGIRWTFGLKTGQYDEHPELRGGTMITLNGSDFAVKHVLFDEVVN